MILSRGNGQARHVDSTDFGQVNIALTADTQIGAEVNLAPNANLKFIPGAQYEIGRRRSIVHRRECYLPVGKQSHSVDGQHLTSGCSHEALKLGWLLRG